MHRKRLLKQIGTTYGLFKAIRPHDLPEVLKEYQGIDIKLDIKGDAIKGYTIHDKSGYAFKESELGPKIGMEKRLDIFGNGDGPTEIDTDSKQFKLGSPKTDKRSIPDILSEVPGPQRTVLGEHNGQEPNGYPSAYNNIKRLHFS